jgi:hypothetical protein
MFLISVMFLLGESILAGTLILEVLNKRASREKAEVKLVAVEDTGELREKVDNELLLGEARGGEYAIPVLKF